MARRCSFCAFTRLGLLGSSLVRSWAGRRSGSGSGVGEPAVDWEGERMLRRRPRTYTDMEGCSMSRFSRLEAGGRAAALVLKQAGGVRVQLSSTVSWEVGVPGVVLQAGVAAADAAGVTPAGRGGGGH